jgi:2-oxoisovalerate dehydrogenase E1 component alpha subunit
MNLAGVHALPVVFLCENNELAISVPLRLQMPVGSVAERAAAYGMPGVSVDGTDAVAVLRATREAVRRARAGDGPSLLEFRVPRLVPHSSQDDEHYRTAAEKEAALAADPLPRLRAELLGRGLLDERQEAELVENIRALVRADADRAWDRPEPEAGRARCWLYAGDPPHPAPVDPDPVPEFTLGVFDDD